MIIHTGKIFLPLFFLSLVQIQCQTFTITNYVAVGDGSQLFLHDIPGFFAQKVKGWTIHNFQLSWTGTRRPFITHGIKILYLSCLHSLKFVGTASYINKPLPLTISKNGNKQLLIPKLV
jgi:hypothetical protein